MNATVRDFMNTEIVYLREGARPDIALRPILDFGITAVPVLDDESRPVGVVSLRDLVAPDETKPRVTEAVVSIRSDAPMSLAARVLVEAGTHHLVVVDEQGRACGMLSALDVVRALTGMPARHPAAIERFGHEEAPSHARTRS